MPEDFNTLRRLLALKRHEQPPPGYFHRFSREVIVRLQAGGAGEESFTERLREEAPWLGRLLESLRARPMWSGAVGATACALMLGGLVWVQNADVSPSPQAGTLHPALAVSEQQTPFVFNGPLTSPQIASATNAGDALTIPASLFNGPGIDPQRVQGSANPLLQP